MKDLIERQAAIDAVIKHLRLDYEYAWGVREAINALPSAQPEQRWTPVKNPAAELPKDKWLWVTHVARYHNGLLCCWVDQVHWDMTEWSDTIANVIAYMPYEEPEPYTGEGEQDEPDQRPD